MMVFSMGGSSDKKWGFDPKYWLFQYTLLINLANIRSETWAGSKSGWAGYRIKFSIEWQYFQWGSSSKKRGEDFGVSTSLAHPHPHPSPSPLPSPFSTYTKMCHFRDTDEGTSPQEYLGKSTFILAETLGNFQSL